MQGISDGCNAAVNANVVQLDARITAKALCSANPSVDVTLALTALVQKPSSKSNKATEMYRMARHTSLAVAAAAVRALTNAPLHDVTPLLRSAALSNKLSCDVFFKMDCAQPPGSFKLRGIGATVKEAVERGADGVVSSSGGNAGLATAHAALALGIKCTVVLPTTTPDAVRRKLEDEYGAEVIVEGAVWDEANERAKALDRKSVV